MLERALALKEALMGFCQATKSQDLSLPVGSWALFEKALLYLTPFRRYTNILCGDTYPTLSLAVPMYNKLLTHFDNWIRHETNPDEPLHKSIVAAHEKIMNYYNLTNESTICTVLHPRFGINYYKRDADGTTDANEKKLRHCEFII